MPKEDHKLAAGPQQTLAERAIEINRDPERLGGLQIYGPKSRAGVKLFTDHIREAIKVELADNFIEVATWASLIKPSLLLGQIHRCLVPHDLLWIEWNETKHLAVLKAAGPVPYIDHKDERLDSQATRVGILSERLDAPDPTYHWTVVTEMARPLNPDHPALRSGAPIPPVLAKTLSYVFDPNSAFSPLTAIRSIPGRLAGATKAIAEYEQKHQIALSLGEGYKDQWWGFPEERVAYRRLAKTIAYSWPGYHHPFEVGAAVGEEALWRGTLYEGVSSIGDARFVLAVLTLWNTIEYVASPPWRGQVGARRPSGKREFHTFKTLEIKLPKDRVIGMLSRKRRAPSGPLPQHDVAAHVVRTHRVGSDDCRHQWDVPMLPHTCLLCGMKQWHRRAHKRGDPNVGIVTKRYRLISGVKLGDLLQRRFEEETSR